jgi:hypothetical protein
LSLQEVVCFDLTRIAIGKKIFKESCRAEFSPTSKELTLSYAAPNGGSPRTRTSPKNALASIKLDLGSDNLREVKYFHGGETTSDDEDQQIPSFISLDIKKSESNGLLQYANSYDPGLHSPKEKRFIVLEFRNNDDKFVELLARLQNELPHFVNDLSQLIELTDAYVYCGALCADNEKGSRRVRSGDAKKKGRSGFLASKDDDAVLVVYPFDGDSKKIDEAGDGLPILECTEGSGMDQTAFDTNESSLQIVIRARDYERLDPEVYLNDTIIDFFCQW